jgi:hypothetical protein
MAYGTMVPQYAGIPPAGGDLPVRAAAAISAGLFVVLDTARQLGSPDPLLASTEVTSLFVRLPPVGGHAIGVIGWLPANIDAGQGGPCRTSGVVVGKSFGSISASNFVSVCTTASHLGEAQLAASGDEVVGRCLVDAVDGGQALIMLYHAIWVAP